MRKVVFASLILLLACGGPAAPLPPAPPIVPIAMRDHRFEFDQGKIIPARVIFPLENKGNVPHHLLLIRLPEDLDGTLDEQLRSPSRRPVGSLQVLPTLQPGVTTAFAVDLTAGRYGFVCLIEDADGVTHAVKGMNSEFEVP